jgi:hypothetical protein
VSTAQEAASVAAKIIGYDECGPSDEIALVADSNDGYNFELMSGQLKPLIPQSVRAVEIKRGEMGSPAAKAALIEAINRGQKITNYAGHGSVGVWRGGLFASEDVGDLFNQKQLSLFVMMTCLNAYFHDPAQECLAEALLRSSQGGAVAVWGSSGMAMADGQALMNQELYRQIFNDPLVRLGEAVRRAKVSTNDLDVRRSWILLGDPSTRLK